MTLNIDDMVFSQTPLHSTKKYVAPEGKLFKVIGMSHCNGAPQNDLYDVQDAEGRIYELCFIRYLIKAGPIYGLFYII